MNLVKRFSIILISILLLVGLFQFSAVLASPAGEPVYEIDMSEHGNAGGWVRVNMISPSGEYVAVGLRGGGEYNPSLVKVFDVETGEFVFEDEREGAIVALAWSPDSSILAVGSHDETISIWDANTWELIERIHTHDQTDGRRGVEWLAYAPDGRYLYSYGRDDRVIMWDTNTWELVSEKQATAPDGNRIIDISRDGTKLAVIADAPIDPSEGLRDPSEIGHDTRSPGVKGNVAVQIWDAETLETLGTLLPNRNLPPTLQLVRFRDVRWSPDGNKVLVGASGGVAIFDANTYTTIREISFPVLSGWIYGVAWSAEGSYFVAGCNTNNIFVFDAETFEKVWEYGVGSTVLTTDWSLDGEYIAFGNSGENYFRLIRWLGDQ